MLPLGSQILRRYRETMKAQKMTHSTDHRLQKYSCNLTNPSNLLPRLFFRVILIKVVEIFAFVTSFKVFFTDTLGGALRLTGVTAAGWDDWVFWYRVSKMELCVITIL